MEKIYWIDDSVQQLLYILHGAISKLWEIENLDQEGIASELIVFGNAWEEMDTDELLSREDQSETEEKIRDHFEELCIKNDGPNKERPSYNKKKRLIENCVKYVYVQDDCDDIAQYKRLKNAWINTEIGDDKKPEYMTAAGYVQELIKRMNLQEMSVVGIDIALLYDDMERLEKGKRILSMELYNKISRRKLKCFMYSSEADDDDLMNNWLKVYSKLYKKADVDIYQRSDLMQRGGEKIIDKIKDMFLNDGKK